MLRLLLCITLLIAGLAPASAQTRRAFIVGIKDYANLADLPNTAGDADGYAEVFGGKLGFKVTLPPQNPTLIQFLEAFDAFEKSIAAGDDVVFVFAGHGWAGRGQNFLVPSDTPASASETTLEHTTIPLATTILERLRDRKPRLILAIIDACRDNPFSNGARDGLARGLIPTPIFSNTLVVYSAGERQKALDSLSPSDPVRYSVFTRALLPRLGDANRPLLAIFDETRDEVQRLAGSISHLQRPAFYSDLSLKFCLSGNCAEPARSTPQVGPVPGSAADFENWAKGGRVYFDFDRYNLSSEAISDLVSQYAWLKRYPDKRIEIEGHAPAEEPGQTQEYLVALGERRANAVKEFLVSRGVAASRITTISFGKSRPLDLRETTEAQARNRRVRVRVLDEAD